MDSALEREQLEKERQAVCEAIAALEKLKKIRNRLRNRRARNLLQAPRPLENAPVRVGSSRRGELLHFPAARELRTKVQPDSTKAQPDERCREN